MWFPLEFPYGFGLVNCARYKANIGSMDGNAIDSVELLSELYPEYT